MTTTTKTEFKFDYKASTERILGTLKRDRDRQIISRRFGFGLPKRQTLEKIGLDFGITRERVRQIEKAALTKIQQSHLSEVERANKVLAELLQSEGGVAKIEQIAQKLNTESAQDEAYVIFLATLAGDVDVIDEDDRVRASLALGPSFNKRKVRQAIQTIIETITAIGKPATLTIISNQLELKLPASALKNLARISKDLAEYDNHWGLTKWPAVNPKSIRDKTYLVLTKHGQPLHFSAIAERIRNSRFTRRDVTVQAVHNELIKDPRFILIGRGIYALAEWGYTPGTVADIIVEILRQESPLHKDAIIDRVLAKRQVKTTTIILNLQEKEQFERVAKATYKLREK